MTGINVGLGAMGGPVYAAPATPVYAYVLNAHAAADFEGCSGEVGIPDNIILQYFYDPSMKDAVVCLSKDGEKSICAKEFPMRQDYQFTSDSPVKPPNLILFRLDDLGTNTGFYECHSGNWIASEYLGPVEPNPSRKVNMTKAICLTDLLAEFSAKFTAAYGPYAKAGIYMAVCSTPFGRNLPSKSVYAYDPSVGSKKTLYEHKRNERLAELEELRTIFVKLLMEKTGRNEPTSRKMATSIKSRETLREYIEQLTSAGGGYKKASGRKTSKKKARTHKKQKKTRKH